MTPQATPDVIFINDDKFNNLICTKIINTIFPEKSVCSFTNPVEGLHYISATEFAGKKIVLFLDINMPVLNGWNFLDKFALLPELQRISFDIYILSSSIDSSDRQRAESNPFVKAYVEKPLTQEHFIAVL